MASAKDTVVLFDIENIIETDELKKILSLVYENILDGASPYVSIAYADWSRQSLAEKRLLLLAYGVVPQQVISYGGKAQKNAADIALCVDAVELLMDSDIKRYVLITGDGGFISLVSKLKKYKKEVIAVSTAKSLAAAMSSFVDEVHTPEGIVPKHEKVNREADYPYFKALWAISKSYNDLKEIFKVMLSKASIVERIDSDGLDYETIESILKSAKFHPDQIKKSLIVALKNKTKFTLVQYGEKVLIVGSENVNLDRMAIVNNVENRQFVYKRPIAETFSKEYVLKAFAERGIELSKGAASGEILDYIISHYTRFKKDQIESMSEEIAEATRRKKSFVFGALNLLVLLGINQTINSHTTRVAICSRIVKLLAKDSYKKWMYSIVSKEVLGWD